MNPDSGEIKEMSKWEKELLEGNIFKQTYENLVPFEVGEIVELKGCRFKVRSIWEAPRNIVTLEGIARKEVINGR